MGNPNTIWGYADIYHDINTTVKSGDGDRTLYSGSVPSGEIWRVEGLIARNADSACTRIRFEANLPDGTTVVAVLDSPAADEPLIWGGALTLKAGDDLRVTYYGCLNGDNLRWDARGYTMVVPG